MNADCYCGFGERPSIYAADTRKARKKYKCYECFKAVEPGERYERAKMLYEGVWETMLTCDRCLKVREYILAHVPCFCWMHGSLLADAKDAIEEYAHLSFGFFLGAYKRLKRAERYTWKPTT